MSEARLEGLRVVERLVEDLQRELDARLRGVKAQALALAEELQSREFTQQELEQRIEADCRRDPLLSGVTVAFQPFRFAPETRLYAPFFDERRGQMVQLEESYDYTDKTRYASCRWFLDPVLHRKPVWTTGYGEGMGASYADYDLPFFETDPVSGVRRVRGTVNMTISLDSLKRFLNKRNIGRLGGGYILDREGRALVDPFGSYSRGDTTVFDIARKDQDKELLRVAKRMLLGQSAIHSTRDGRYGQPIWLAYRAIPCNGWSLGIVVFQEEVLRHQQELRRRRMFLVLNVVVFIVSVSFLATGAYTLGENGLWLVVAIFSVSALLATGYFWELASRDGWRPAPHDEATATVEITDWNSLDAFLAGRDALAVRENAPAPIAIPTGIFVRSLKCEAAHEAQLSGRVWQRYTKGVHDECERGIVFLDAAPEPEAMEISEAYRRVEGDVETIAWDFHVLLRQKFDYSAYPCDRHRVRVRLGLVDGASHALLVPDLDAYEMINSHASPGLHESLVAPGWKVEGSRFSYDLVRYNTNFGTGRQPSSEGTAELQFNVLLARKPLSPFLSHVFPNIVVAILLFGVLVNVSLSESRLRVSGFSGFGALEVCAAFFFAVILLHIDLRRGLAVDTITYVEWLHLILYLMLLLVAVNSLILTNSDSVLFIEYRDNLLPKVLYWPVLFGLVLAVTTILFY